MMVDLAKRDIIDANEASNDRGFWINVQAAFITSHTNEAHNKFMFQDNQHLANTIFNPQQKEHHSWEKQQSIWKDVDK